VNREKNNPLSPWKPYLDVLPATINVPFLWPEEDRAYLRGSWVLGNSNPTKLYQTIHLTKRKNKNKCRPNIG
jgi:hypothetical protein